MKRVVLAAALAAGFVLSSPASAGAWATYCDWDPLVLVVTPSGHVVPVYDSVWTSSLLAPGLPLESYTVSRVYGDEGRPETLVDMTIYVPTGLLLRYPAKYMVTSGVLGSGAVYAQTTGNTGKPVHLKFVLPVS